MAASQEEITADRLTSIAPGLRTLLHYRFGRDFRVDLAAGISVAAVALPVAVAYAQLAGFNPVYGLYTSILPLIAYAIFGTSRQLIVNPDAATCALVAAAVAPLAGSDSDLYLSLSVTLTFLSGLLCIGASFLRLGALADFLSRPILIGFLNGIAISIFVGQLGKVLGISVRGNGIISQLLGIFETLPQAHLPTVGVSFASLALLFLLLRFLPRIPGALVVLAAAAVAVAPKTLPGLALFRFNAPLTFFNTDYFKQRALRAANQAGTDLQWFVIDAIPISDIDTDGLYAIRDLNQALAQRGVTLIIAGRRTEFLDWLHKIGICRPDYGTIVFPTLRQAVKAFRSKFCPKPPSA